MFKRYFDIVLGVIIIAYTIAINCISSTRIAFSSAFMFLGIFFIIYHFIKKRIKAIIEKNKPLRIIYKLIIVGLLIIAGGLCIIEGFIIGYPKRNTEEADYIIVLGAGLRDGNQLSMTLKDRLDAALSVMDDKSMIVVSGGKGNDEKLSEAEAMKNYLIECGIDEKRIIKEDMSVDTNQNLRYSKEKIEKDSGSSIENCKVKIVTTDFHACRASYIAEKNNYKTFTVYTSKSLNYLIPIYYTRESLAMVKTIINNL